jgi:hypothetical protein
VLDKLPGVPSRLAAPGLAARLAGAAASGVVIARRADGDGDRARPAELLGLAGGDWQQGIADSEAAADSEVAAGPHAAHAAAGPHAVAELGPPASPGRMAACVLAAAGAAAATAWAGARWRAWASGRLGPDWIAAGLEDAAAFALAGAAVLARR